MHDDRTLVLKLRLLALALLIIGIVLIKTAEAADPPLAEQPNPDVFPCCAGLTPAYSELLQQGIVRWSYARNPSCAGDLINEVVDALNQLSAEMNVLVFYDDAAPMRLYVNCGPDFNSVCTSAAAACLGRGFPRNCQIDFSNKITTYFYVTRVSIAFHEILHCLLVWNEQYNVLTFSAVPGWHDFMNTGSDSRHYFEYIELQRWARTAGPAPLGETGRGNNGAEYVWWGGVDRKTTRMAILAWRPADGRYRWTGVQVPLAVDSQGRQGFHFEHLLEVGEVVCVNPENAASTQWGRNDVCLP